MTGREFRLSHFELAQQRALPFGALFQRGALIERDNVRFVWQFNHDNPPANTLGLTLFSIYHGRALGKALLFLVVRYNGTDNGG
jgi:hypothetical protein